MDSYKLKGCDTVAAFIKSTVRGVFVGELAERKKPVVILDSERGALPLLMNVPLATTVHRGVARHMTERPLAIDLLTELINQLGVCPTRVEITHFEHGLYFGLIRIQKEDGQEIVLDCRPGDAVALALRTGCDILVAENLFDNPQPPESAFGNLIPLDEFMKMKGSD